jgi:4-aminobutyrate aminotransferase-like enzyme
MTALDEYDRLSPWENAARMGDRLIRQLTNLSENNASAVVSVTGKGLLISLKLMSEDMATKFCAAAGQHGVLVETGGVDRTTVLFRPSLLIHEGEADRVVSMTAANLESL